MMYLDKNTNDKNVIFEFEITNWEKYNKKARPSYPYIFLSKRFFEDNAVQRLPNGAKLLFIGLLILRGHETSRLVRGSYEVLLRFAGGSGQVVHRLMRQLESFQLVTYRLLSIKEKKRIESNTSLRDGEPIAKKPTESVIKSEKKAVAKKLKPVQISKTQNEPTQIAAVAVAAKSVEPQSKSILTVSSNLDKTTLISKDCAKAIACYVTCFKNKYKARPTILGKDRGIFLRLLKDIPINHLCDLLQVYLQMQDPWFVKTKHGLSTFEQNITKISVALQTGKDDDRKENPFSFFDEQNETSLDSI